LKEIQKITCLREKTSGNRIPKRGAQRLESDNRLEKERWHLELKIVSKRNKDSSLEELMSLLEDKTKEMESESSIGLSLFNINGEYGAPIT